MLLFPSKSSKCLPYAFSRTSTYSTIADCASLILNGNTIVETSLFLLCQNGNGVYNQHVNNHFF